MPRYRQYIDVDVVTEARNRLHHIYDIFDHVVVLFSGGKDSLATLYLVKEVAEERGERLPIRVVFRDEEIIHKEITDFVETFRHLDWVDMEWWTVPLKSARYVLGEVKDVILWDPERGAAGRWAREKPPWGLSEEDLGLAPGTILDQHEGDAVTCRNLKGSVCLLTGVRSSESIMRWASCVNKLSENYLVASSTKQAMLGRPIFDWEENDVFRYFYDNDIQYCPIYDAQMWAGTMLRCTTSLNPQASKVLHALEYYAPDSYDAANKAFPETALQRRYYQEWDKKAVVERYAESWDTIREWVLTTIRDPGQQALAIKELDSVIVRAQLQPDAYELPEVLKCLMRDGGRRTVQPKKPGGSRVRYP